MNVKGTKKKNQVVTANIFEQQELLKKAEVIKESLTASTWRELETNGKFDKNKKLSFISDDMLILGCDVGSETHYMRDNTTNTKLQSKRLKLRNSVYSKLSTRYHDEEENDNQMVRHFYNRGEDAPLWAVFEILYLSDLASFFECLNESMREHIMTQLNMFDVSIDTNRNLLSSMLYTIKSLRNSVAHNNIIFDTRFKDRKISPVLKKWGEKETGIQNITLYSLIDYIIIVCCLLKRVDFSSTRAKQLVHAYKKQNQILQSSVAPAIYTQIIQQNVTQKITALETYLNT